MNTDRELAVKQALATGDLSLLDADQRREYLEAVCESLGLNPLTRPLEYLELNGKLTLYARRDATDQLRRKYQVSIEIVDRLTHRDIHVVRARATMPDGRTDESLGAVSIANLDGEALANRLMTAETKAKRRVTLSICGTGLIDASEVSSIDGARPVDGGSREMRLTPADVLRAWDAHGPPTRRPLYDFASSTFGKRIVTLTAEELEATVTWIAGVSGESLVDAHARGDEPAGPTAQDLEVSALAREDQDHAA